MSVRLPTFAVLLFITLEAMSFIFCAPSQAQVKEYFTSGGDILTIEGDKFTFETKSVVSGEQIMEQDVAVWEGGVVAKFKDIVLKTDHIEANFSGPDISGLRAGPKVNVTALAGRAQFESTDVLINFATDKTEKQIYTGVCTKVHGSYLATAEEFGLEGTGKYEVHFIADEARLEPETAVLKWPQISLGDLANPDLALKSREITLQIGVNPTKKDSKEREILGVMVSNASLSIFGVRLHLLQFPYYRGFVKHLEPGWSYSLPTGGWKRGQGPFIDESSYYDFYLPDFEEGPLFRIRLVTFPFDRTYPELSTSGEWNHLFFNLRAGYRREQDSKGNPVPTRAEPQFDFGLVPSRIGKTGLIIGASAFAGHLRDTGEDIDLNRFGYNASLRYPEHKLGIFKLSGQLGFTDFCYQGGDNYRTLDSVVRLRYADPPDWGTTLSYRNTTDWGSTPFRFDEPQVKEEIGLKEQTRLSDRWGAGFDWAWDLAGDEFQRQVCNVTYIFDSFQMTTGWDLTDNSVHVRFDLPGSLR